MIVAESLIKRYGNYVALRGVSFTIPKREVCGLLGPNGAGKSTTLKIVTGFLEPNEGRRLINGLDPSEHPQAVKSQIGYVPETPILYKEMKVLEYLIYVSRLKGLSRSQASLEIEQVIVQCGLTSVVKKTIGAVSRGYRQRTALAQALIGQPSILFLDEPTSALDPVQVMEVRALIRSLAQERTVILCTHILQEAAFCCDRVLILNEGKIVAEQRCPFEVKALEDFFFHSIRHL